MYEAFLNDVAIGILGGLAVFFYLSASHANHCFECAKEQILLIRELNLRIRGAMEQFASSAISDDRSARLEGIDEATDRIDSVLAEFMMEQKNGLAPTPEQQSRDGVSEIPDPYDESILDERVGNHDHEVLRRQTRQVTRRARLIRLALLFFLVAVALLIVCSLTLVASRFMHQAAFLAAVFFVLGLLSMLGRIIAAMLECAARCSLWS